MKCSWVWLTVTIGVAIREAHNIILAQIGAGLYFDQFQRNFPRVFEGVGSAEGNVYRLVPRQQPFLSFNNYPRCTRDHNPVFGAVMVHPHRYFLFGHNGTAFDLIAVPCIYRSLFAPAAIDFAVNSMLGAAAFFQALDNGFYVLNMVFGSD